MTITARAAVVAAAGATPAVEQISIEDPAPGEVAVQVAAAGICHTDLAIASGELWPHYPIVLGHEIAGVVVATGTEAEAFLPGERVVIAGAHCGQCSDCERGQVVLCRNAPDEERRAVRFRRDDGGPLLQSVGGFSEITVVAEESLVRIPDGVPFAAAAVTGCAVATGAGAVLNTAGVRPGQSVAVLGAGGVGCCALMAARAAGARRVVAADPSAARQDLALRLGATDAVAPEREAMLAIEPDGFDVVVESAGVVAAMELAPHVLRRGGLMVLIGAPGEGVAFRVEALDLVLNQKRITGCLRGGERPHADYPLYFDLYRRGLLDLDALVTATVPLDRIAEGFDMARSGEGLRTVVVNDV